MTTLHDHPAASASLLNTGHSSDGRQLVTPKGVLDTIGGALRDFPPVREPLGPTYQPIRRYKSKLRNGILAVVARFKSPWPGEAKPCVNRIAMSARPVEDEPEAPEKQTTPLQDRIERHKTIVDRALDKIRQMNPEGKKWYELPAEVRDTIAGHEQAIRAIIDTEVRFWASTIADNPLIRIDATEEAWVGRVVRLAGIIGTDNGHRESLDFLVNWKAHVHHQ
jgi:hypothetical protein